MVIKLFLILIRTGLMLGACLKTNCFVHKNPFKVKSTIANLLKLDPVAVSLLILIMAAMKALLHSLASAGRGLDGSLCTFPQYLAPKQLQSKCHDNSYSVFSLFSQCKVAVSNVLKIIDFLFITCEFCCFLLIEDRKLCMESHAWFMCAKHSFNQFKSNAYCGPLILVVDLLTPTKLIDQWLGLFHLICLIFLSWQFPSKNLSLVLAGFPPHVNHSNQRFN